jgi:hypothetical protein
MEQVFSCITIGQFYGELAAVAPWRYASWKNLCVNVLSKCQTQEKSMRGKHGRDGPIV